MGGKEKKRSKKASSQVRKKMRHRSRRRKRSSKKMRRPEDSYSKSDDESRSLASSSSEEDGKRRRSKSRAGKDGKARKRRARSSSSGSDGSFDSRRAKKRKRSKRKVEGGRKKAGKKSMRAVSVSSESDESDYEKPRGSSKKKELSRRYGKKDSTKERKRYQSPSVSTSSGASEKERKRKRYQSPSRSPLSVSSESQNRTKRKRYWSPSGSSLSVSGSRDQHIENEIVEVQNKPARKLSSIIVLPKETDLLTMSGEHEKDYTRRDEYGERSSKSNLVETVDQINKSRIEDSVSVRDSQNLESILRLKALENLKKFRGPEKAEKSGKAEMRVQVVKQLPEPENAADQERLGGGRMKHSFSADKDPGLIIDDSSKDVDQISTLKKGEVSTTPSGSTESISEPFQLSKDNKVLPKAAAQMVDDSSLDPPADKKSNIRDDRRITVSQPGQSDPLLASQEPPAACSTKEPKLSPPEPLGATPELDRCSSDKSGSIATDKVKPKSVSDNIKEANTAATSASDNPSSPIAVAGEHHAELKESSQFQEKTMSVMRGGELVQVSYKVYIPKKAPAVARRRLKR